MRKYDVPAYDRVLQAAAKLFALRGFEGTTTRDIVKEAGSSLSVLQTQFGSKQALYQAVMETSMAEFYHGCQPVMDQIQMFSEQCTPGKEQVMNAIDVLTDYVINWAMDPDHRYLDLLIHREMLFPNQLQGLALSQLKILFESYQKLFLTYAPHFAADRIMCLAFSTVASIFDLANYPQILGELLEKDLTAQETISFIRLTAKETVMNSIQANLSA